MDISYLSQFMMIYSLFLEDGNEQAELLVHDVMLNEVNILYITFLTTSSSCPRLLISLSTD